MADFTLRFFLANLVVSIITGSLLVLPRLLKSCLTCRTRYHLWFLLLGALTVPFLPFPLPGLTGIAALVRNPKLFVPASGTVLLEEITRSASGGTAWMTDFGLSAAGKAPSPLGLFLSALWIGGILFMIILFSISFVRLRAVRRSALPIQSHAVRNVYENCLAEMQIRRFLPLYGTAFLKSPMLTGLFKPCIFLPLHLVSDFQNNRLSRKELKFMLLHELQHYRHRDLYVNAWMNLACVIYWFNPLVRYALKEMRNDREIACDASVLDMLRAEDYADYGNTLINYAEKLSRTPFPFTAGLGESLAQMKKRILHIADYRPASFGKKLGSCSVYFCAILVLSVFLPALSTAALDSDRYAFGADTLSVTQVDYSTYFGENSGSFVLFDTARNTWTIYQMENAVTRIPPASTYKIYAALHALETGVITPEQSLLSWNGISYPYASWNRDQTLESAMENSVTWYFQTLDLQMGAASIAQFIREIGYGNQTADGNLASYWYDSTLKISPVEQVELLRKFHDGALPSSPENSQTVKDAICLASLENGTLYGKTGTSSTDGKNTLGWFIGYIESEDNVCYFAANIQNEDNAGGSAAAEITLAILSDLGFRVP